jgi:ComF family protein
MERRVKEYIHSLQQHIQKRSTIYKEHLQTMWSAAQSILSPPHCAACLRMLEKRTVVCTSCFDRIQPVVSTTISITPSHTMRVFAISGYEEPLKRMIVAKAWSDIVAASELGTLLWEHTYLPNVPFDIIVPIPLHWTRYAWRGYNQAEEMAAIIARKSNKPLQHLLTRSRRTIFQSSLPTEKRPNNVRNVFSLTGKATRERYQGKHILLIDDLMTTGSTLKEAGKQLLHLKPASITAAVACRIT